MTNIEILFDKVYNNARQIEFNRNWSDGIGHYDFAIQGEHAPKVGNGKVVATKTPGGKRVIIVGTRLGNVIVYEDRVWDNQTAYGVSRNSAINSTMLVTESATCFEEMLMIIGDGEICVRNIGERIEDIYTLCKRSQPL